ncbi:MAG: NADPH-dependent FMN reductase [Gammaproteobacteria bacterium]
MNRPLRLLALAGSTRRHSYNKTLVRLAAGGAAGAGAEVRFIDLADYPMPLFDEDLEAKRGLPESVTALRERLLDHHGFLLASPEYNGSLTAVLKNALDWLSRPHPDGRSPFADKVAALLSASPGGLGGLRGLDHARAILTNLGVLVLPRQFALPAAHEAFTKDGRLKDPARQEAVAALGAELVQRTRALRPSFRPESRSAA